MAIEAKPKERAMISLIETVRFWLAIYVDVFSERLTHAVGMLRLLDVKSLVRMFTHV